MAVHLPPQIEAAIRQRIETGPYRTIGEVIKEALLALDERDRLEALRAKVQVGLDQLDRGEGIPFTPEWRADRRQMSSQRAASGETQNLNVYP